MNHKGWCVVKHQTNKQDLCGVWSDSRRFAKRPVCNIQLKETRVNLHVQTASHTIAYT